MSSSAKCTTPPPPPTQIQRQTFSKPPPDVVLFPALYDWHYTHSPDHPLFVFEDASEAGRRRVITWREGLQGAQRATDWARRAAAAAAAADDDEQPDLNPTAAAATRRQRPPVFAILSASDTLPYFVFLVGVLRAISPSANASPGSNFAAFPISPKLTREVIAHLLVQVNATHLVVSGDEGTQELADAVLELVNAQLNANVKMNANANLYEVRKCAMPTFDDLFPTNGALPDSEFTFHPTPHLPLLPRPRHRRPRPNPPLNRHNRHTQAHPLDPPPPRTRDARTALGGRGPHGESSGMSRCPDVCGDGEY